MRNTFLKITGYLLFGLLTSCVYFNKLQYIEPISSNEEKWINGWTKNPLNIKYFYFKRFVRDSLGNNLGLISFYFYADEKMFSKPQYFSFNLSLEALNDDFIQRFDLDSIGSHRIRDSLMKKRVGTDEILPNASFYLIGSDSTSTPMAISEYFLGNSPTKNRNFRISGKSPFLENSLVKIVTGDIYLDKLLGQSIFLFKTKKKVDFMTHMN